MVRIDSFTLFSQCLLVLFVSKEEKRHTNNRLLGIISIVYAPAMLIGALLTFGVPNTQFDGITSMVFVAGWICSNIGMQRMQVTGTGGWERAVLLIQLVGRPRAGVLIWLLRGDGDTRREQPRLCRNRRVLGLEYGADAGGW